VIVCQDDNSGSAALRWVFSKGTLFTGLSGNLGYPDMASNISFVTIWESWLVMESWLGQVPPTKRLR